jgi:hypothetical protein
MDEASAAHTIESPCTPHSGIPYIRFGFDFAVHVTEMAKLGPSLFGKSPIEPLFHVFAGAAA